MLYDDHFSGHLDHRDPRTPVHGAAGCTWPTIPAMRYLLKSENATGAWAVWNTSGTLLLRVALTPDHDQYDYVPAGTPPGWSITRARKSWNPSTEGYTWELFLNFGGSLCVVEIVIERPEEKCNVDVAIGDRSCPALPGSSGSSFSMRQVEWNDAVPP